MDITPIADKLNSLGISRNEAQAYVALLRLKVPKSIKIIQENTAINRSTLYVVLNKLIQRGLASESLTRGVRQYTATSPENLTQLAREKKNKFLLLQQNLTTLLPEMRLQHKGVRFKPRVSFSQGSNNLRKVFEETLHSKEKVLRVSSSANKIFTSLPDYLPIYVRERIKKGIKMYGMHPDDKFGRETLRRAPNLLDDSAHIPSKHYKFPLDFVIFDDKITCTSHTPPYSITIQSIPISNVMKVAFDLAHKEAKRLSAQISI